MTPGHFRMLVRPFNWKCWFFSIYFAKTMIYNDVGALPQSIWNTLNSAFETLTPTTHTYFYTDNPSTVVMVAMWPTTSKNIFEAHTDSSHYLHRFILPLRRSPAGERVASLEGRGVAGTIPALLWALITYSGRENRYFLRFQSGASIQALCAFAPSFAPFVPSIILLPVRFLITFGYFHSFICLLFNKICDDDDDGDYWPDMCQDSKKIRDPGSWEDLWSYVSIFSYDVRDLGSCHGNIALGS